MSGPYGKGSGKASNTGENTGKNSGKNSGKNIGTGEITWPVIAADNFEDRTGKNSGKNSGKNIGTGEITWPVIAADDFEDRPLISLVAPRAGSDSRTGGKAGGMVGKAGKAGNGSGVKGGANNRSTYNLQIVHPPGQRSFTMEHIGAATTMKDLRDDFFDTVDDEGVPPGWTTGGIFTCSTVGLAIADTRWPRVGGRAAVPSTTTIQQLIDLGFNINTDHLKFLAQRNGRHGY